ncbi:PIN domain-containing protein [Candidatus Daviesbacteria bacterium]|nr:PIN domain-containing protein [Candidatus Daviesbacteria bacterium]
MIFLDTNIILRFVLKDHPIYSPKAEEIIGKIDSGKVKVYISWPTILKVVFVLQNSVKLPKKEIAKNLLSIFHLENVLLEQKILLDIVFEYYMDKNISLTDAYNAALMQKKGVRQIYSFDEDFDKFPQIKRLEK